MPLPDCLALPHCLDRAARTCLAIVECSRGGRGKFHYDSALGMFTPQWLLPAGVSIPADFWTHHEQLRGIEFTVLGTQGAGAAVASVRAHSNVAA